ncbi:MAG: hypothetical protein EXQ86_08200 [Rhodospirillales bacterium]|nr:hypothetical protein [Rhodospirillales bacterium]
MITRRSLIRRIAGFLPALAASLCAGRDGHAATFSATDRRCATCDFWRGKRKLSADGKRIIVPDDERGFCTNGQSPLSGKVAFPGQVYPDGHKTWRQITSFGN